jgi:hypothetical protein
MDVSEGQEWAVASDGNFDLTAESVAKRHDKRQHQRAEQPPLAAFPHEKRAQNEHGWIEISIPAGERHQLIQYRIDQRPVEKPKQLSIRVLKPFH